MYSSILLLSILFSILTISILNIVKEEHQIILFIGVLICFIIFYNEFGKMITYNKNNSYGNNNNNNNIPITNSSVYPSDTTHTNIINNNNNITNLDNLYTNNTNNNISTDKEHKLNRFRYSGINEKNKYINLKYSNLKLISEFNPIKNNVPVNYKSLLNPTHSYNNKLTEVQSKCLIKRTNCIEDSSCII